MGINKSKTELMVGLTPVEIFNMVLDGSQIKRFPNHFWEEPHGRDNAIIILKYLLETILQWSDKDIKEKFDQKLLKTYKLSGMHSGVFGNCTFAAINAVYPNRFKEWDLKSAPNKYWTKENGIKALKHLFEEVLKWTDNDIKEKLCQKTFYENGLSGLLKWVYNGSVYNALDSVYPTQFKEWELKYTPMNFWSPEKGIEATRWLFETKLQWSDKEMLKKIRCSLFKQYDLGGMLTRLYNNSAYLAINAAYPDKFKEWELANTTKNLWSKEKIIAAVQWLFEKIQWDKEKIECELTEKIFKEYGLDYMLISYFGGYSRTSAHSAVMTAYPQIKWNFPLDNKKY